MDNTLWWRDGIIYQIYPRSFADGNGDGIGDLIGITGKLDYLADLGIDAIWLSPIYPSPDVDFGYDVSNYRDIDPKYGTMADFDRLVVEAHKRKIHIVMDMVLNHTSDQHPWFLQSRSSKDNPYRDWYIWRDGKKPGKSPNNWQAVFGGKAWEYDQATDQYYYHMFCPQQPDLNWRNPAVRQEIMNTFRFWLGKGVDGFRLDVFNEYFKDAQFRDNPFKFGIRPFDWQQHKFDYDQPEVMDVVAEIRSILDAYPDRYVVGETFLPTPETAVKYVGNGKFHAAFDFRLLASKWDAARYLSIIQYWDGLHTGDMWPNYVLDNHDNPRSATRFGRGEDDERMKVAAALQLTLRGTPYLYYGEEIGMRDIHLKRSEIMDPIGKRYWPFHKGRDGCRSPMQWSGEQNAGFSNAKPWLKVNPDYLLRNVELQKADPRSLLNFYRELIRIRRGSSALCRGMFQVLTFDPRRLIAYLRQDMDETVLVVLNFGKRKVKFAFGADLRLSQWTMLLSSKGYKQPRIEKGWMYLDGEEACVLKKG